MASHKINFILPDKMPESCRWGKKENPYPYLGENRANPLPPICHNISLFLLQAMGLVREISLRLRKGTTEVVVYGEVWPLATGHRPPPPPTAKPKRNKAANSEE